ncbi:thiolase domain-containing protein [Mesorhizobium microcysteis]|uniref:Thiolase domain-containing protein n=1 Tax=Neoaquamicrobium microcysteis TaxID=2682781 RepID=A0A5D4GQ98_9HYPH|nr:thiolase domain-containing protein [Mesorhizobium microcysteis]TYR30537.1 thiolase domain-containing protein [Mesorhizobium microcysteis]
MTIKGKACIAGVYEHPTRRADDISLAELHADVIRGALDDAGLSIGDVDGFFCDGDAPGLGALSMLDYLGMRVRHVEASESGGATYLSHVAHAAQAIAAGKLNVAVISMAGRPRAEAAAGGVAPRPFPPSTPDLQFELPYGAELVNEYALAAMRHMYEFGTTAEQLAWVKVAASQHAQHNPHAMMPKPVTVEDVLASPMIADPLHRLDCCIVSDGGGAAIVVRPEIARDLKRRSVTVLGHGEAAKHQNGGRIDLTYSAAAWAGADAFAEAGLKPRDIDYASIYDSFTITVITQLEDLGFCAKGEGGRFVADGGIISGVGRLPVNTDGGGLCNNHPGYRGGMTKIIEAVRQLRGEAAQAVQVKDCRLALAQAMGGSLGTRHAAATLILEAQ